MSYTKLSRAIEEFLLHKSAAGRSNYAIAHYRNQLNSFSTWLGDCPTDDTKKNWFFNGLSLTSDMIAWVLYPLLEEPSHL